MKFLIISMLFILISAFAIGLPTDRPDDLQAYKEKIAKWRAEQDADLRKPESWLSLTGLFWLNEGENTLGIDKLSTVTLPTGEGPEHAGTFVRTGDKVTLNLATGISVTVNGKPVSGLIALKSDKAGRPDRVKMGAVTMIVVVRGVRVGIRLWNSNSAMRKEFKGMHWFPVNPAYRVSATFTAYNPPRKITFMNILGDQEEANCPGYLEFELQGKYCRIEAQGDPTSLFLNFHDFTSGKSTYPAGRFLETASVVNGKAILDFNQAINPPCAYTHFATCPLPPRANYLTVEIAAGEKTQHVP